MAGIRENERLALSPGQEVLAILSGRNPRPTRAQLLAQRRAQRKAHKAKRTECDIQAGYITSGEIVAGSIEWNANGPAIFEGVLDEIKALDALRLPASPPARRDVQVLKVVDVEPDWDVVSMIDAHRNGATALDEQRHDIVIQSGSGPVFQDVSMHLWDPRHEMGPRERDWIRTQKKRASGNNHRSGR